MKITKAIVAAAAIIAVAPLAVMTSPASAATPSWTVRTCSPRGHAVPDCTDVHWKNYSYHGVNTTSITIHCVATGSRALRNVWFVYRDQAGNSLMSRHPAANSCNHTFDQHVLLSRRVVIVEVSYNVVQGGRSRFVLHHSLISHDNTRGTANR